MYVCKYQLQPLQSILLHNLHAWELQIASVMQTYIYIYIYIYIYVCVFVMYIVYRLAGIVG